MTSSAVLDRLSPRLRFREFVAIVAAAMALNALSIDMMLPALPDMGTAFKLANPNRAQWIIAIYMLGFGGAQLIYGPLSDRFGRRPVLLVSIGLYILCSLFATFAATFTAMLVARFCQGMAAAGTRVVAVSVVRDCFGGRQMARVMSIAHIVFLAAPVLAPSIGQAILVVAPWRWIFGALAMIGTGIGLWVWLRLPETGGAVSSHPVPLGRAVRIVLTDRNSVGYTVASTLLMGTLFGFVNSVQQIFADVFADPDIFPLIFAAIAITMAGGAFLNTRIVERFGTRRVSHSALLAFIALAAAHAVLALAGLETLHSFALFQAGLMFCFGLTSANFSAMAMEGVAAVAGTASSLQGFFSTVVASLLGIAIGQAFDGSVIPLTAGALFLGLATLPVVLLTEGGRMFRPHQS